jgi:hypothetical protein
VSVVTRVSVVSLASAVARVSVVAQVNAAALIRVVSLASAAALASVVTRVSVVATRYNFKQVTVDVHYWATVWLDHYDFVGYRHIPSSGKRTDHSTVLSIHEQWRAHWPVGHSRCGGDAAGALT